MMRLIATAACAVKIFKLQVIQVPFHKERKISYQFSQIQTRHRLLFGHDQGTDF